MNLYKNKAGQKVLLQAMWISTSAGYTIGAGATSQASNITAWLYPDGSTTGGASATANPTEITSDGAKGRYVLPLSQAETNFYDLKVSPKCSTAGVVVDCEPINIVPLNFDLLAVSSTGGVSTTALNIVGFSVSAQGATTQANIAALSFATTGQGDAIQADIAALTFATTGQAETIQASVNALSFATTGQAESIQSSISALSFATTGQAETIQSELAKVPKSDGSVTWNATALGSIEAECFDAMDIPVTSGGVPTAGGMLDYTRKVKIITVNKLIGDEVTGEVVTHDDNDVKISSAQTITTLAGVTLRERML